MQLLVNLLIFLKEISVVIIYVLHKTFIVVINRIFFSRFLQFFFFTYNFVIVWPELNSLSIVQWKLNVEIMRNFYFKHVISLMAYHAIVGH